MTERGGTQSFIDLYEVSNRLITNDLRKVLCTLDMLREKKTTVQNTARFWEQFSNCEHE